MFVMERIQKRRSKFHKILPSTRLSDGLSVNVYEVAQKVVQEFIM